MANPIVGIRMAPETRTEIEAAAAARNETLSEYVMRRALEPEANAVLLPRLAEVARQAGQSATWVTDRIVTAFFARLYANHYVWGGNSPASLEFMQGACEETDFSSWLSQQFTESENEKRDKLDSEQEIMPGGISPDAEERLYSRGLGKRRRHEAAARLELKQESIESAVRAGIVPADCELSPAELLPVIELHQQGKLDDGEAREMVAELMALCAEEDGGAWANEIDTSGAK